MKLREVVGDEAQSLRLLVAPVPVGPRRTREERATDRAAQRQAHREAQWLGEEPHYHAVLCDAWGNRQVGKPCASADEARSNVSAWLAEYRSRDVSVERKGDEWLLWRRYTQRVDAREPLSTSFDNVVKTGRVVADRCERSTELSLAG